MSLPREKQARENQAASAKEPDRMVASGLRPRDQVTLAWLVGGALVGLAVFWWLAGMGRGWVEIEQAPPLAARFAVDINSADWPEFAQLPGIGETLARRIIDHRDTFGPFSDLDALLEVPGIGDKKLAAIRPFLLPPAVSLPAAPANSSGSIPTA